MLSAPAAVTVVAAVAVVTPRTFGLGFELQFIDYDFVEHFLFLGFVVVVVAVSGSAPLHTQLSKMCAVLSSIN
jgi:hypothetical protein